MDDRTICVKTYLSVDEFEGLNTMKKHFGLSHSALLRMWLLNELSTLHRAQRSPAMGLTQS